MSTGAISAIGDTGSQLFVERYSEWDAARTLRFSVLGLVLTGPTLHFWYGFLFRRLPGVTVTRVLQRVALDQFFFAPLFTFSFISVLFAAEQRSYESWSSHMANNFAESVGVNWMMWIPAQVINFRFIPASYSVLFANFVAVFWNSYVTASGSPPDCIVHLPSRLVLHDVPHVCNGFTVTHTAVLTVFLCMQCVFIQVFVLERPPRY